MRSTTTREITPTHSRPLKRVAELENSTAEGRVSAVPLQGQQPEAALAFALELKNFFDCRFIELPPDPLQDSTEPRRSSRNQPDSDNSVECSGSHSVR